MEEALDLYSLGETQFDWLSANSVHDWTPEKKLMAAILENAIEAAHGHTRCVKGENIQRAKDDAVKWLQSNSTGWCFSFLVICETLNLDPHYIRRQVSLGER